MNLLLPMHQRTCLTKEAVIREERRKMAGFDVVHEELFLPVVWRDFGVGRGDFGNKSHRAGMHIGCDIAWQDGCSGDLLKIVAEQIRDVEIAPVGLSQLSVTI